MLLCSEDGLTAGSGQTLNYSIYFASHLLIMNFHYIIEKEILCEFKRLGCE